MDLAHLVSNYEPKRPSPKCSLPSISHLLHAADSHPSKRPRHEDWDDKPFKRLTLPPTPPLDYYHNHQHHHHSASFSSSHSSISLPSLISDAASDRRRSSNSTRSSISIPPLQSQQLSTSRLSLSPSDGGYPSPAISTATTANITHSPSTNKLNIITTSPSLSTTPSTPTSVSPSDHHHHQQHHHHATTATTNSSTWQHHHYFPPSNTASYPLNHDRYICRICHKAFSRPSSLRIHSHSHTGEKPFRCPHLGCGKAFSVRSNMKRHERGCHSARAAHHASSLVG